MTALELLGKLRQVNVAKAAQDAIVKTEQPLEDVQREQLFKGLRSDNQPITPYYTAYTKSLKEAKGQPTDRVTLKDHEDYYDGIDVHVKGDIFQIFSTDSKDDLLEEKYGAKILGLGTDARMNYVRILRPVFLNVIKMQMA